MIIKFNLLISIILCGIFESWAQEEINLGFEISQTILPYSPVNHQYSLEKGIFSIDEVHEYDNSGEYVEYELINIFRTKISSAKQDSLIDLIKNLKILELDSIYSEEIIDGMYWHFNFNLNEKEKKIRLDNAFVDELSQFLQFINLSIPIKQRFINIETH